MPMIFGDWVEKTISTLQCNGDVLQGEYDFSVCAHDAGSAQHIINWLKIIDFNAILCLTGPARRIYDSNIPSNKYQLTNKLEYAIKSSFFHMGTGWQSSYEHDSRLIAKRCNKYSASVIDHWVNYSERFTFNQYSQLPDSILVTDQYAFDIASKQFALPIFQLRNSWLRDSVDSIINQRQQSHFQVSRPATNILYFLEPIREIWSSTFAMKDKSKEFYAYKYFIDNLFVLQNKGIVHSDNRKLALALRPHPSQAGSEFDDLIAYSTSKGISTFIDPYEALYLSLANTHASFGYESQALVLSLEADLPTCSIVPPWAPVCRLPHRDILHLRDEVLPSLPPT